MVSVRGVPVSRGDKGHFPSIPPSDHRENYRSPSEPITGSVKMVVRSVESACPEAGTTYVFLHRYVGEGFIAVVVTQVEGIVSSVSLDDRREFYDLINMCGISIEMGSGGIDGQMEQGGIEPSLVMTGGSQ